MLRATSKYLHTPQHSVKIVFLYQSKILRSKLLTLVNFANFLGERTHFSLRNELDICNSVVKGHRWLYSNIEANADRQWCVQAWWSPIPALTLCMYQTLQFIWLCVHFFYHCYLSVCIFLFFLNTASSFGWNKGIMIITIIIIVIFIRQHRVRMEERTLFIRDTFQVAIAPTVSVHVTVNVSLSQRCVNGSCNTPVNPIETGNRPATDRQKTGKRPKENIHYLQLPQTGRFWVCLESH